MEGKKGHTPEEADRILREAEERKRQAEAAQSNEPKITPADLAKKIEELGSDFLKEQKDNLNTD
ncbi:MAG: hypothetical protein ACK4FA_00815 [Candidatus Paceibacteria bacterium]